MNTLTKSSLCTHKDFLFHRREGERIATTGISVRNIIEDEKGILNSIEKLNPSLLQ